MIGLDYIEVGDAVFVQTIICRLLADFFKLPAHAILVLLQSILLATISKRQSLRRFLFSGSIVDFTNQLFILRFPLAGQPPGNAKPDLIAGQNTFLGREMAHLIGAWRGR